MMKSFTEGIGKIYYDLDDINDLQSRLHFEALYPGAGPELDKDPHRSNPTWKDYGKTYWDKIKKPTAAVAALGALALWYRAFSKVPEMDPATKAQYAFDIYQHTIAIRGANLDKAAKEYVFTVDQLYGDSDAVPPEVTKLVQQIKTFNAQWQDKERIEAFKQRLVHWDRELEFDKTEAKIDAWAAKSDDLATAPPVSPQQPDIPPPPPKAKSPWAPGLSKPAGWKDPRGFQRKKRKQPRKESNMKTFETFENKVSNWVPEVTEGAGEASAYADTWLYDHAAELETADEGIGIEDIIDRIADDYADATGEPADNAAAAEIVNAVVPVLTNDYGWVLDPDSDILSRYTTVDEEDDDPGATNDPRPTGVPRSPFDDTVQLPARVEGQPWVHSDDDFVFFLEWLLKKEWTARQIVDVVSEPHHYIKEYKQYLHQRERQELDPLL